ncbi:MAG: type II toxin-antitoxin system VapC family toxin [Cereibacter changlensis]
MYLLDTTVLSALRRPDRAPKVAAWLSGRREKDLFLSVITIGEIERDICQQETRDLARDLRSWLDRTVLLFADRLLPFDSEDARIWGRLSAEIDHPVADLMIAASALSHAATVATGNTARFMPTGVRLENPF